MTSDVGLRIIGGLCLVLGVLFALWGDRRLPESGTFSSRVPIFPKASSMKWLKWAMGGALASAGLAILFHR